MARKIWLLILISLLLACQKHEGYVIDTQQWQEDAQACQNLRQLEKTDLATLEEQLQGMREVNVKKLLGKPDRHELYVRSQKHYIYFLEPGPDCKDGNLKPLALYIRFDALGRAKSLDIRRL